MEDVMHDNTQTLQERNDVVMRSMEAVPTQIYWGLAMGSVVLSALFFLMGKRNTALFVGQWPPTFLALAVLYKLLSPSQEPVAAALRDVIQEVSTTAD
jgi:hypothetical protein